MPTEHLPETATTSDAYGQVEQRMDLEQALALLDATARQIVVLRYLEDLPVKEISALLNRPAGTVRRISADALRRLAPQLQDHSRGELR
ncbi:RNA polymerase sigma factor (sigma-70 family) [Nakamurella flavida]|nr:RNA polymerase sigma factor (sigma-70 family) [Nakamurella flavida]